MATTYEETAKAIIKDAIKSAVFIDENATEPYSDGPETEETARTIAIYRNFRKEGISLSVYQYQNDNYVASKDFIFSDRDLVLLDWKLEGESSSGEKSLKLLSEIVNNQNHIHFCVIYTTEKDDIVLKNILSYFSEITTQDLVRLRDELSDIEEDIKSLLSELETLFIYRFDNEKRKASLRLLLSTPEKRTMVNTILERVSNIIGEDEKTCSLIKCYLAYNLDRYISSEKVQPSPSSIDTTTNTLCINNTIITIVNKSDVDPSYLFQKFGETISQYEKGVMQLIGLEMKNIQKRQCSFIDNNVLSVSKNALGYQMSQKKNRFGLFLKNVMVEQLYTILQNENLSLLGVIEEQSYDDNLKQEYIAMNVFYNSVHLQKDKPLSFGDVFLEEKSNQYFICITALCDCAQPKDNRFYFAEGTKISNTKALEIGDNGFVSFLNNDTFIRWGEKEKENEPLYIMPKPFYVPKTEITNGQIDVDIIAQEDNQSKIKTNVFKYITTIKQNYAQRIANHAFMHPIRVGIDFVKKEQPNNK